MDLGGNISPLFEKWLSIGESTRPESSVIDPEEELSRILPMIEKLKADTELRDMLISVDTRKVK